MSCGEVGASPSWPLASWPNEYSCPVDVTARLKSQPPAVWITGPVAPGSVTSIGVGLGEVLGERPSSPSPLSPNAYSWPVVVVTRLNPFPPPAATCVTSPVAPGSETGVGGGLALNVPTLEELPSCPALLAPTL